MSAAWLGNAILSAITTPQLAWLTWRVVRIFGSPGTYTGMWISVSGGGIVSGFIFPPRSPSWAAGSAVSLVAALIFWWWRRRKGKRSPKAMGAKSRALIAAMVKRAREAARPRPVLRPLPQPAGSPA